LAAEIGDVTSRLPLRSGSLSSIASKPERRKTQAAGGARTKPVVTRAHRGALKGSTQHFLDSTRSGRLRWGMAITSG
jgi:hypothetical protein